jgi:hypothetical protein
VDEEARNLIGDVISAEIYYPLLTSKLRRSWVVTAVSVLRPGEKGRRREAVHSGVDEVASLSLLEERPHPALEAAGLFGHVACHGLGTPGGSEIPRGLGENFREAQAQESIGRRHGATRVGANGLAGGIKLRSR